MSGFAMHNDFQLRLRRGGDDDVADFAVAVQGIAVFRLDERRIKRLRPDKPRLFSDGDDKLDHAVRDVLLFQHPNRFQHRRQARFIIRA